MEINIPCVHVESIGRTRVFKIVNYCRQKCCNDLNISQPVLLGTEREDKEIKTLVLNGEQIINLSILAINLVLRLTAIMDFEDHFSCNTMVN